jgi:segregation and condensation protein B
MNNLKAIIEALVFVSENPLTIDRIGEILADEKKEKIACIVYDLVREYDERKGGIFLREVAGGYQFRTGEDTASWVMKLKIGKSSVLSRAAMETLAVIAYRQPVMKSEIEKVRGVDVGGILKGLMEKDLVRMMGRKDVPGRPIIYGTTKKFLEVFNLKDLSDLPTLKELEE